MSSLGPNTNAPAELVHADCVLIVGEDPASTEALLADSFGPIEKSHSFRGYVFQRRNRLTTIFSGMGTACLEPLLWELADARRAKRLVLVGTAGLMPGSCARVGQAYRIGKARSAGTGMNAIGLHEAFSPRWPAASGIPGATAVSTDFYYGFSRGVLQSDHPLSQTDLPSVFRQANEDLVDMEVAQFYGLCSLLFPPSVQFVAVKSPANPAGEGADQLSNTPSALSAAVGLASQLLELPVPASSRTC